MDWILGKLQIYICCIYYFIVTNMQQKTVRKGECIIQPAVLKHITALVCLGSLFILGLKTGIRGALLQIGAIH